MEASLSESKRKEMFIRVTRWLLLGAVALLSTAGGLTGIPKMTNTQSILSKVAYFEFIFVLLALIAMAAWLSLWRHDEIQDGQIIVRFCLLLPPYSTFLSSRFETAVYLCRGEANKKPRPHSTSNGC